MFLGIGLEPVGRQVHTADQVKHAAGDNPAETGGSMIGRQGREWHATKDRLWQASSPQLGREGVCCWARTYASLANLACIH